jgi:hypothetical protein
MVGQNGGQIFLFSGFMSAFTIPSGNLPNASSVGANMKGPSEVKASSRSATFTAATKSEITNSSF